jgi:hypothetical protein
LAKICSYSVLSVTPVSCRELENQAKKRVIGLSGSDRQLTEAEISQIRKLTDGATEWTQSGGQQLSTKAKKLITRGGTLKQAMKDAAHNFDARQMEEAIQALCTEPEDKAMRLEILELVTAE